MKYVFLAIVLSPLFLNFSLSPPLPSTDLNEIILDSDLIVYATAVDDCVFNDADVTRQVVHFDIVKTLKGKSESLLSVTTEAIFRGDIPHQLIDSKSFNEGKHYLLFLRNEAQDMSFLVNHTLVEIEGDQEITYFTVPDVEADVAQTRLYEKTLVLNSIESFLYNEIEILESELVARATF